MLTLEVGPVFKAGTGLILFVKTCQSEASFVNFYLQPKKADDLK